MNRVDAKVTLKINDIENGVSLSQLEDVINDALDQLQCTAEVTGYIKYGWVDEQERTND